MSVEFEDLHYADFVSKWSSVDRRRPAPSQVIAYVYSGQWVADCSYPDCYNTQPVSPGEAYGCIDCKHIAEVVWPSDAPEITEVLSERPVRSTRYWAPAGHRQAMACGFPEGQTVADLREENREHL